MRQVNKIGRKVQGTIALTLGLLMYPIA